MDYYSPKDFIKAPKFDAHIHYQTLDDLFVLKAAKANMSLLSINTDLGFPLDQQFKVCQYLKKRHPQTFAFLGTFDASAFASETFAEDTVKQIKKCMAAGARGIKIWKNIGMTLKNGEGQYIMADDPLFDPIYAFLEKEKIPLLAHLGESCNCWLPFEQMTTSDDALYYRRNPEYHAYTHPEVPSYERQIMARDRILEHHPGMIFIGAHLSCMESDLEELAKRLDQYPNFFVDIAACFGHLFYQTLLNRDLVINFFDKYQDRILYGSDWEVSDLNKRKWLNLFCKFFPKLYMGLLFINMSQTFKKHWLYLSTNQTIKIGKICNKLDSPTQIEGIKLPKKIVDRIFYENVRSVYFN